MHVKGAELAVFDQALLLSELITIEEIGRVAAQFAGREEVPDGRPSGSQPVMNVQTTTKVRERNRQSMASMHRNVVSGNTEDNSAMATEHVAVESNGEARVGRDAFVEIVSARNQGHGAFPEKQFQDEYIVVDGRLGAIEYIWHGRQKGEYMDGYGTVRQAGQVERDAVL